MKKIITSIILIMAIGLSYGQENIDAVFKNQVKEYTLNSDGSIDYREIKEVELHSHYAFHRLYGETFIIYNTDYQELKFNHAYTIMKDGKKIVTPDNAFNQVLPRFCNHSPAYNHIREMVVTHTGLEVGATINLDYTISTQKDYYPGLMAGLMLLNSSPTEQLIIKVNVPEEKELYFDLLNIDTKPDVSKADGMKTYTWTFIDLPATSKDRYQPAHHSSEPQLNFSTLTTREAYDTFVNQEAFSIMSDESMTKVVDKETSECADDLKKVLKLQKIVSNNLGNLYIPMKYSGFKCRNAIDTWNSNQGTPLEKALLLKSLLNKASINSEVVAVMPKDYYGMTGDLSLLNTFAVKVDIKKHGEIYLQPDATNSQSLLYDWGGMAVIPLVAKGKLKPMFPKTHMGEIDMTMDYKHAHSEDPKAMVEIKVEKRSSPYYSIYKDSAYVKRLLQNTSGVSGYEISRITPEETKATMQVKPKVRTDGLYHYLTLPQASNGVDSWHMTQLTSEIDAPLEFPELINEKYKYTITIPGDAALVSNETFTIIDNEVGVVKLEIKKEDGKIKYYRNISFKKKIISIDEYPKFKKIMDLWNTPQFKEIVYKRTNK